MKFFDKLRGGGRCKQILPHQSRSVEFGFSIDKLFSISNVKISTQQLHQAVNEIALIADDYQYTLCERYKDLKETDPRFEIYRKTQDSVQNILTYIQTALTLSKTDPEGNRERLDRAMTDLRGVLVKNKEKENNIEKKVDDPKIKENTRIREDTLKEYNAITELNEVFDETLKKFSKGKPAIDIDLLRRRAEVFYKLRSYQKAMRNYDQILDVERNNSTVWCYKGIALCMQDKYEEATEAFDEALKANDDDAKIWCYKGIALLNLKRYEEATEAFDESIVREGNTNINMLFLKCKSLLYSRKDDEAKDCFDNMTKIDFRHYEAWYYKAMAFARLQNYEECVECINKAMELNPKIEDASIFKFKAAALSKLQKYDEVPASINEALKINEKRKGDRSYFDLLYVKGLVYLYLQKYREAAMVFDQASKYEFAGPQIWYYRGVAQNRDFQSHRDRNKIIGYFRKATDLDPNYADAWAEWGASLINDYSRKAQALQYYDKAFKINSRDPLIWYSKGNFFYVTNFEEALKCYLQAIKLYEKAIDKKDPEYTNDPNYPEIYKQIQHLLLSRGHLPKAEEYGRKAEELKAGLPYSYSRTEEILSDLYKSASKNIHYKELRLAKSIMEKWLSGREMEEMLPQLCCE